MESATAYDIGLLATRIGLAILFLAGAIIHTKDSDGRNGAIHFTSLLFLGTSLGKNVGLMKVCAFLAVVILYVSGLGVLLGVEIKIAAALMFVFAACGFLIHARDGQLAFEAGNALEQRVPGEAATIGQIKFSAFVGNMSSAIKNAPVMGAAVLIMLQGGGAYSLSKYFGI